MMLLLQQGEFPPLLWILAAFWASSLFTEVFADYHVVPYILPSFLFDWTPPGQSPPVPTTAQCQVNHISWGRQSAKGPNPVAPYSLEIFTSAFVFPFSIDAGNGLEFDFQVPFIPGTQYQTCMWDSVGNSGGCQAMYTVYQAPNTTLDDPPICRNVTFQREDQNLGVETAVTSPAPGNMSQFGWIDQCTDISVKPTNGTPPYTMTIAPSFHPPINITSNNMDSISWTNTLSWGVPFFVSLVDSSGMSWANGPLHSNGGGSTECFNIHSPGRMEPWVAGVVSVLMLLAGLLIGLMGAVYALRRARRQHLLRPEQFMDRKSPSTTGLYSVHTHEHYGDPPAPVPPGLSSPSRFGAQDATHNRMLGGNPTRQFEPFGLPPDPETGARAVQMSSPSGPVLDITSPTLSRSLSNAASQLLSPSDASTISPGDVRTAAHVYVVHHDGGRPPVTVYTEDGTEVVELPPRYASPPPRPPQTTPTSVSTPTSPPLPTPQSTSTPESTWTPTAQAQILTQERPPPDLPKPPLSPNQHAVTDFSERET